MRFTGSSVTCRVFANSCDTNGGSGDYGDSMFSVSVAKSSPHLRAAAASAGWPTSVSASRVWCLKAAHFEHHHAGRNGQPHLTTSSNNRIWKSNLCKKGTGSRLRCRRHAFSFRDHRYDPQQGNKFLEVEAFDLACQVIPLPRLLGCNMGLTVTMTVAAWEHVPRG